MSRGRRYDDTPKLNVKKVIATVIAIIVVIMVIYSIRNIFKTDVKTQEVSTIDTYFPVYSDGKWGVIDNSGETVIKLSYDEMVAVPDKNKDLFIATYDVDYDLNTYSTKVLNKNGEEILTRFSSIEAIENTDGDNIWYENNILKYKQDGLYGLIDFDGKVIVNPEYQNIYALEGIQKNIIVEKDGKKGLVNTVLGEIIINAEYDEITTLTNSYENGYIVKKDGKYGVISADAKVIFEPVYDVIYHTTSNGNYVVMQDGKDKVINNLGETILDSGFDTVKEINSENLVIIVNGVYGVIDLEGDSIIEPQYEELKYIYGNYYIAKRDGLYGVISTNSEVFVDFQYTSMTYIKTADFIEAEKDNYKTDLIDRQFNVVLSDVIVSELNLDDGYIRVRENDAYKYYNFKNKEKTNKEALPTSTLFLIKENGKYGYENKNGDRIVDCIYDDAKEQNRYGYCAVKKDGVWGCLKSDGTIVVSPSIDLDEYLYVDFIGTWYLNKDLNLNVYTK